jgi:hypothetical protein
MYAKDRELVLALGLSPMDGRHRHGEWLSLGLAPIHWGPDGLEEGEREAGLIEIEVQMWPACFFRFTITCHETGRVTVVQTGSGSLHDYWRSAVMIAQGMFVPHSTSIPQKGEQLGNTREDVALDPTPGEQGAGSADTGLGGKEAQGTEG